MMSREEKVKVVIQADTEDMLVSTTSKYWARETREVGNHLTAWGLDDLLQLPSGQQQQQQQQQQQHSNGGVGVMTAAVEEAKRAFTLAHGLVPMHTVDQRMSTGPAGVQGGVTSGPTVDQNREPHRDPVECSSTNPNLEKSEDQKASQENRRFSCDQCTKSFKRNDHLKIHQMTHTGAKPHQCPHCHRAFRQKPHLQIHLMTHTVEKPFECQACGRRFRRKSQVQKHMSTHKHMCRFCYKHFRDAPTLRDHMRVHMEWKVYRCDLCSRTFNRRDHYRRHCAKHGNTGGDIGGKYACGVCGKCFMRKSALQEHAIKSHEVGGQEGRDGVQYPMQLESIGETEDKRSLLVLRPSALLAPEDRRFPCSYCGKSFKRNDHLKIHQMTHTGAKPHQCHLCQQSFRQKPHLQIHLMTHTVHKPFDCALCGRRFRRKGQLQKHHSRHAGGECARRGGGRKHVCGACGKYFTKRNMWEAHVATHNLDAARKFDMWPQMAPQHQGHFNMDVYQDSSQEKLDMEIIPQNYVALHLDSLAEDPQKQQHCPQPESSTNNTGTPSGHTKALTPASNVPPSESAAVGGASQVLHLGGMLFCCGYCSETFLTEADLRTHLTKHSEDRRFCCHFCLKAFKRNDHLKTHLATHTSERPFRCDLCLKPFRTKSHVKKHRLTHSEERPHECGFCDKRFRDAASLKDHMRTHVEGRMYRCELCGKAFGRKDHCKRHLMTHTAEKPFPCEHCGKAFRTKSHLQKHRLTHGGSGSRGGGAASSGRSKSHVCEFCDEYLSSASALREHVSRLHMEAGVFSCDQCSKTFARKDHLKRHLATHVADRRIACGK